VVHYNLGGALVALGRHEEAITAYRKAVALDPRFAEAYNHLGRSLAAQGRHDEAVESYRQAIALKPDDAEALGNLAAAYHQLKRYEEAIGYFEQALALQPGLAEAHNDIGNALVALERTEEAVERYRRALAITPQFADAHNNIGNALVILDRHREAVPHFMTSLAIKPDVFEILIGLGSALVHIERNEEAIANYQKALELRPESAETHWLLGGALEAAGRSEEAVAAHRRALAIQPEFAGAHNALGFSLVALGRLEEGRLAVERAIELAPATGHFHRNLAMAKRFSEGDLQLEAMEALVRDPLPLDSEHRMELHFALGKAYADLHRQEDALRHLIEANAIKRGKIKYDEADTLAQFDRISEMMTLELMQRKSGAGVRSDLPIFILGMPRSGTTLIEQILASHPDVFGAGELGNFSRIASSYCGSSGKQVLYTEIVPGMPAEQLGEIGARYLESVRALSPDAPRITDKMPANFRFAGLIHLALPGARIIHARRDPLATCLSCFERHFARDHQPFTYDLAELGRYYRAYEGLMAHWHQVLPAGAILDVQYEDVVQDLESQARRILEYCGLAWDPRCLAFHRTERPVHTASVVQVREPIYRSSLGRWQSVRHMLGPLLDELGIEA
jgi:tetratricopeptide (TPR) repeat protein